MVSLRGLGTGPGYYPGIPATHSEDPLHSLTRAAPQGPRLLVRTFRGHSTISACGYRETEAQQGRTHSQAEVGSRIHR